MHHRNRSIIPLSFIRVFVKHWWTAVILILPILFSQLLLACKPSLAQEQAEDELVAFMLDHIVTEYAAANRTYIAPGEQREPVAIHVPSIIIWAPPAKDWDSPGEILKLDQPIQVWSYRDGSLSEQSDQLAAIQRYRQDVMNYPENEYWGYYTFGIFSIADDGQQAEVYLGASCGPMCGSGVMLTLQRNASGDWEISETELVWIV